MTLPRVLGFVFNPVSFWLCYNNEQKLIAVINEVNNTFGETHTYVVKGDLDHEVKVSNDKMMR